MNIKETFISLTSETYPYGYEEDLFSKLPQDLEIDEFGNLYKQIGDNPSCMFTSHLDTASHEKCKVKHVFEGDFVKTDGTSILGADDKAGVTIMLYMMKMGVKGLYYFFLGEERGCIGSKKVAQKHKETPLHNIKKVISFDRRGTDSIITFQSSQRCCSETFALDLSEKLNRLSKAEKSIQLEFNYSGDPTGIYTDSYQFMYIYPECTNISVGYYSEHTRSERQDLVHLEKLAKTCVLIDWEELKVERNPNRKESVSNYSYDTDIWEYSYKKTPKEDKKKVWFIDDEFDKYVSLVEYNNKGEVVTYDVNKKRINKEENLIKYFIKSLEVSVEKVEWNGIELICKHKDKSGNHTTRMTRKEIIDFVPEIDRWKTEQYMSKL